LVLHSLGGTFPIMRLVVGSVGCGLESLQNEGKPIVLTPNWEAYVLRINMEQRVAIVKKRLTSKGLNVNVEGRSRVAEKGLKNPGGFL
jgi:hypothetical protein